MEVGKFSQTDRLAMKRICQQVHHEVVGRLPRGVSLGMGAEEIASSVVEELRLRAIGILVVDEAGGLTQDAVRGLMLLSNTARRLRHPLSIVFVGMDDLPRLLTKLPQHKRRTTAHVFFDSYSIQDTLALLRAIHPHFAGHRLDDPQHRRVVEFIHRITQDGLPGYVVPFLNKLDRFLETNGNPAITPAVLKTVQQLIETPAQTALRHSGYGAADASRESQPRRGRAGTPTTETDTGGRR
jgi:hypothetical protein